MSTELSAPTSATPDVIASTSSSDASTATASSPVPDTGTSSPDVNTGLSTSPSSVQGEPPSTAPEDPLAGLPSDDELQAAVSNKIPHAEALARIKSAYSEIKPQLAELQSKYAPFESLAERFTSADELQPLVELNDKLFSGFERDDTGQLVPAVKEATDYLFQRDQQRASYIWAESAERQIPHPQTGQPVSLMHLALEGMRDDPVERAQALSILGGVEPSAQPPTWAPTEEQLAVVRPELQDTFRNLPYDEREDLSANTPEFINNYLRKEKFQQDLIAENQKAQEFQAQERQRVEQRQRQEAENAGNAYVEQQFRTGFTEFANSIVEKAKFIPPLEGEAAQGMPPEQVQAYNQQAEQINKGVGTLVATVTAALCHPDTQWLATDFLKSVGVDEKTLQSFDQARTEFAQNARNYGELAYARKDDPSIGSILSNSNRAMTAMKGRGNLVAQPLLGLLSKFFEMKATSYNTTLNSAPSVRAPVNGNRYDPTSALPTNVPTGKMTRAEIDRLYG